MQRRCVPSPLVGEGQGGGSQIPPWRIHTRTPHPNPPPQGGRERAERAAHLSICKTRVISACAGTTPSLPASFIRTPHDPQAAKIARKSKDAAASQARRPAPKGPAFPPAQTDAGDPGEGIAEGCRA